MRLCLLFLLLCAALRAATIRGTVLENQTGHPLARALVALQPVAGTNGPSLSVRTSNYGTFQFSSLPPGSYLLTASRTGFAGVQYGQKQWQSSGVPVVVSDSDSPFLTIRLPRWGSITGAVLDENDVGLPEYEVVAYRNTRPPQLVTRAKTDDRGAFRLYGLKPGSYLIRSAGKKYDDAEYLPTFSKETQIVDQAYAVDVNLDQQVDRADVRPTAGRLYMLKVEVTFADRFAEFSPVNVTLASNLGRETRQGLAHQFGPLPPGQYEIFAEAAAIRSGIVVGAYEKVNLSQDRPVGLSLRQILPLQVSFEGPNDTSSIQLYGRRKDLAGEGASELLKLANGRVQLAPGPWELAVNPPPGFYVAGFSGPGLAPATRPDGWNEISVGSFSSSIRYSLSSSPGALHGKVKTGGDPVAGAPVFLENSDLEPRKRVTDTFVTRTDMRGEYRFGDLAPGNYRVLSSFEYQMPDSQTMSNAGAKLLRVESGRDVQQDLDLYLIQ